MSQLASATLGFEESLNMELPVLYRVAKRLTMDLCEAEDLVAQTLFKAIRAKNDFDGRYFRSWLIRILKNEFAMLCRSQRVRPRTIAIDQLISDVGDGSRQLKELDTKIDVISALDVLPEEYRLPITLCDLEELSYEEAAESLEVPVGTLRSRLHRGRKLLRQILMRGSE